MGWKAWVKVYFTVLFSRELWLSWHFIVLEFLMLMGVFESETPAYQALKCLLALFLIAVMFTTMGLVQAVARMKAQNRVERETAERMAALRERIQPAIQAETVPVVEEPKQSPWYLGCAWAKYLEEHERG